MVIEDFLFFKVYIYIYCILALADLLFNFALVSHRIRGFLDLNSDTFCRLLSFLSHLAELLSACFTAHFTIQRFVAVRFPLSVFVEKNIHLLHYIIVTLFILFGGIFCVALVTQNKYDTCEEDLYLNWFILDALLSFVIPFTIIAILNLLIICHLRKTSRNNQQLSVRTQTKKENVRLYPRKNYSTSSFSSFQSRLSSNKRVPNSKVL